MTTLSSPVRRFDPDRRERILEAALRVIEEQGVDGLTFRAVARAADIPLGSITYHFTDKDGLIRAVTRETRERNRDFSTSFLEASVAEHGVVTGVALLIEELTVRRHRLLVLEHELYLLAIRNPAVREESRQWSTDFVDLLARHTDRLTASSLGYLFDGVCMQAAVFDTLFFAADVEPAIRRVMERDAAQ